MIRVRLFVHAHDLILVYYVFPHLVKCMLIQSLIDHLCVLLLHSGMPLMYILENDCLLMLSTKNQDTSLSEVLVNRFSLFIDRFTVPSLVQADIFS